MTRSECAWYTFLALSPLLAVLGVVWWIVGMFLDAHPAAILLIGSGAVLCAYAWAAVASASTFTAFVEADFSYVFQHAIFGECLELASA